MAKPSIHGIFQTKMLQKARGFSLLEILVAFILLALAMTVLMQIFSTSLNGASIADNYAKATMLAESKLASAGVEEPLKEGGSSGKFDDTFQWQVDVKAYSDPNADGATKDFEQLLFVRLFEVTSTVSFANDDRRTRSVTLTKLQVGQRTP
jgi:general secretion pathway protein I